MSIPKPDGGFGMGPDPPSYIVQAVSRKGFALGEVFAIGKHSGWAVFSSFSEIGTMGKCSGPAIRYRPLIACRAGTKVPGVPAFFS